MMLINGDQSDPSDPYQIALFILQKVSCLASTVGSLMIVSQVSRNKFNRSKPQQRLILGISICDICVSVAWLLTNLLMPPWSTGMLYTIGNQATCDLQGFIVQTFNSTGVMYMVILQIQYLLTIKYGWKEKSIRKLEPFMLIIPPCLGLATGITALVLKLNNPSGWDCWIAPLPHDCTSSYEINQGRTDLQETDCLRGDNADIYQWAFFCGPLWAAIIFCIVLLACLVHSVKTKEKKALRWSAAGSERPKLKHTREVMVQSVMYAAGFFIVWTFPTITRLAQLFRRSSNVHPLLFVLSGTFVASQGFFNAIIYFRPRYRKSKEKGALKKIWSLIRGTLFFCCDNDVATQDKMDVVEMNTNETRSSKRSGSTLKSLFPVSKIFNSNGSTGVNVSDEQDATDSAVEPV